MRLFCFVLFCFIFISDHVPITQQTHRHLFRLVNSSSNHDKITAIRAINELLDVDYDDIGLLAYNFPHHISLLLTILFKQTNKKKTTKTTKKEERTQSNSPIIFEVD